MIIIQESHVKEIIKHSKSTVPEEACGLLVGKDNKIEKIFATNNCADEPRIRYLIDPEEMISINKKAREEGLDLLGSYHSHVESEAYPSQTDRSLAFYELYLIVSLEKKEPNIRAFMIDGGKVIEEEIKIVKDNS